MDLIITAYQDAFENDTYNDTHSRRRLAEDEAYWDCATSEELQPLFSNISSVLSDFNDHDCSHSGHDDHDDHEHHKNEGIYVILYVSFVLFIGCFFNYYGHQWHIPVPFTVVMLLMGAIMEVVQEIYEDR